MIEVDVEHEAWLTAVPGVEAAVRRAAEAALAGADAPPGAELVVLLADDAALRELNAQFRGRDRPTNVLSFPAPDFAAPHLGDVALAFETCVAEAVDQGKPLDAHLGHLVAHGVLHLLGWDHQTDEEAAAMEDLERTVLAGLGIDDPYAAQNETDAERRRSE